MFYRLLIQEEPFNVQMEINRIREVSNEIGGIVTFLGVVRDLNEGDEVESLYLEHYPGMTESQIDEIAHTASDRWNALAITIIHRVGNLSPSEEIVFVGVGSQHRGDSFLACEYIMDYLKTKAAFWKKEQSARGDRWLVTRETDLEARNRWEKDPRSSDNEADRWRQR